MNNKQKMNIAVIFGGKSDEHEISVKSASQVIDALNKEKYYVIPIAITKKGNWLVGMKGCKYLKANLPYAEAQGGISIERSEELVSRSQNTSQFNFLDSEAENVEIDLAFPIGHGQFIEDGKLQGLLEMLDIPYVFSDVLASSIGMNKHMTKLIAKSAGLKIAKEKIIRKGKIASTANIVKRLGLPVVVKPLELGSSVGISIAKDESELKLAIEKAFQYCNDVLLEKFIKGRELTVAVSGRINPKALPVIEIIPKKSEFFDYKAKYEAEGSEEICPANIPEKAAKQAQRYAVKIFKALGCRDLARADFIWNEEENKFYFLEINTIPGMTATSLAPKAAQASGKSFSDFLDVLINGALKK